MKKIENLENENSKELTIELVYLRKVIDNAVYHATCMSLIATHIIDDILYFHNTGKQDEFRIEEIKELIEQIESGKSSQKLLNLNINHITDSMEDIDTILNRILKMPFVDIEDIDYDELIEMEIEYPIAGDLYEE